MIRLSVLDQSIVTAGRTGADAIRDTLALAKHCEALGYDRFWVAEHHNHESIAGSAPEILISAIAATTRRIRVGSAGIMLPHYSSLKVAEQFRALEAIAPGRIDMGLGRAPGSDGRTAFALHPMAATRAEQFPAQVRDLMAWVEGNDLPEDHPFRMIKAMPSGPTAPQTWILGSSDGGAQVAAYFGLPYCFAHFITDGRGAEESFALFRHGYRPSAHWPEPKGAICVWALVAETEEEAERLFLSRAWWRMARDRGLFLTIEPPEVAAMHIAETDGAQRVQSLKAMSFIGTPAQVGDRLRALAERLGIDEIAVLTWTYDQAARRRSYELLAKEFDLQASPR